jgi:hypothetical protein
VSKAAPALQADPELRDGETDTALREFATSVAEEVARAVGEQLRFFQGTLRNRGRGGPQTPPDGGAVLAAGEQIISSLGRKTKVDTDMQNDVEHPTEGSAEGTVGAQADDQEDLKRILEETEELITDGIDEMGETDRDEADDGELPSELPAFEGFAGLTFEVLDPPPAAEEETCAETPADSTACDAVQVETISMDEDVAAEITHGDADAPTYGTEAGLGQLTDALRPFVDEIKTELDALPAKVVEAMEDSVVVLSKKHLEAINVSLASLNEAVGSARRESHGKQVSEGDGKGEA